MSTFLICSIMVVVNAGGILIQDRVEVEGRLVAESDQKYVIDFSEGLGDVDVASDPSEYSKKLVDKFDCVKEN